MKTSILIFAVLTLGSFSAHGVALEDFSVPWNMCGSPENYHADSVDDSLSIRQVCIGNLVSTQQQAVVIHFNQKDVDPEVILIIHEKGEKGDVSIPEARTVDKTLIGFVGGISAMPLVGPEVVNTVELKYSLSKQYSPRSLGRLSGKTSAGIEFDVNISLVARPK